MRSIISPAQRCRSLILADTFAVHPEGEAIYERSMSGSSDMAALANARVDHLIAAPADPKVRTEVVKTMSNIDPRAYRIAAQAVWLADQRERARAVGCPTLVMVGERDVVTPPELSRELLELIASGRMDVILDAGHLANLEQPGRIHRLVEDFLREVEG